MNIRAYFSALQPECILFLQKAKMNSLYCISFFLIAVQFSALNGAPQRGLSWSGVPMSVFVEKNDPRKYPANVTLKNLTHDLIKDSQYQLTIYSAQQS